MADVQHGKDDDTEGSRPDSEIGRMLQKIYRLPGGAKDPFEDTAEPSTAFEKEKSMSDSNKTKLSKIWSAVADYFKAPAGFEQFIDKPVQPLPAYLTLQHLK